MESLWGIDLGGTKVEVAILNQNTNECSWRKRIPTEAHLGYDHILNQITKLVMEGESESGATRPDSIGIGTPGVSDPSTGLIRNSNTVCLIGKPLISDLSEKLQSKLIAANDANCFTLAEAKLGVAMKFHTVFGVILGTGVGGGIVINGKVLNGLNGIAGEWGHNILDPNGEQCYCGKRGCVETVLSGPALTNKFNQRYREKRSLSEINDGALSGDQNCLEFMNYIAREFGKAMSTVVNILDPDAIVLGGGVSNLNIFYSEGVKALQNWAFHDHARTPVLKAKLGDSAGVFGAALLTK